MLVYSHNDDMCKVMVWNSVGVHVRTEARFLVTYQGLHTSDRGHFHCNDQDTAVKVGKILATLHA